MEDFQVVIIGGGVAGLGLAKASVERGFKTLLLEKYEVGHAVSNNSLRIMHAGFRYFQQLNFKRVVQSIKAEAELRELYPELVKPLKCHMRFKSLGLKSRIPLTLAGLTYKILSNIFVKNPNPRPKVVSREGEDKYSGSFFCWYDSLLLDHLELVKKLCEELKGEENFTLIENASFIKYESEGKVLYQKDNQEYTLSTKYLIDTSRSKKLKYTKAVNVVVDSLYNERSGFAYDLKKKGLFFSVPRGQNTAIGTWYFNNLENELSEDEKQKILLDLKQITGSESVIIEYDLGFLPVKDINHGFPDFYGDTLIFKDGNYFDYNAIKYTTFLVEAQKFIDTL